MDPGLPNAAMTQSACQEMDSHSSLAAQNALPVYWRRPMPIAAGQEASVAIPLENSPWLQLN